MVGVGVGVVVVALYCTAWKVGSLLAHTNSRQCSLMFFDVL